MASKASKKDIKVFDPVDQVIVSCTSEQEAQEFMEKRMKEAQAKQTTKGPEELAQIAVKNLTDHQSYGDPKAKFDIVGAFMREGSQSAVTILKQNEGDIPSGRNFIICGQPVNNTFPKGIKRWTISELEQLGQSILEYTKAAKKEGKSK